VLKKEKMCDVTVDLATACNKMSQFLRPPSSLLRITYFLDDPLYERVIIVIRAHAEHSTIIRYNLLSGQNVLVSFVTACSMFLACLSPILSHLSN